jgi:hypothetical protein
VRGTTTRLSCWRPPSSWQGRRRTAAAALHLVAEDVVRGRRWQRGEIWSRDLGAMRAW